MSRLPPRLAFWLLERRVRNPALTGDLLEAFQAGKSRGWFWRQTLMALALALARSLRASRRCFGPVCAGFAAQAATVSVLWSIGWPPRGVSVGWRIVLCHVVVAYAIANALLPRRIAGRRSLNLRRLLLSDHPAHDRVAISRLLAGETFLYYLLIYFGFVCFDQQFSSLRELMVVEVILLAGNLVASAVADLWHGPPGFDGRLA